MRTHTWAIACLLLLATRPAGAQLLAAKDAPVAFGHYHLHVTSVDEHKKFWVETLGGRAVKVGPLEAIAYPDVFVFLQQATPDRTKGTSIDHIAFRVSNLKAVVEKMKAAGYAVTTRADVNPMYPVAGEIAQVADRRLLVAFVTGPDDTRVELIEGSGTPPAATASRPVSFDHVHFTAQDFTALKEWYMKTFGATIGSQTFEAKGLDLPGLPGALQFSRIDRVPFSLTTPQAPPTVPAGMPLMPGTKNHVVDHIGFELRGLEAFSQQLQQSGMKFDTPFRRVPAVGLAIAFITDPWGTSIELTEGLNAIP